MTSTTPRPSNRIDAVDSFSSTGSEDDNVHERGSIPASSGSSSAVWRAGLLGGVIGAVLSALLIGGLLLAFPRRAEAELRPADQLRRRPLDLAELIDRVRPSVVSIRTGERSSDDLTGEAGSGVVLTSAGLVLTNAHVIAGAPEITVGLFDGRHRPASLVGSFPDRDIAVVQVGRLDAPLVPATMGTSEGVQVGDEVVAIGNALALGDDPSVTTGIVSAMGRSLDGANGRLEDLIQTDAAINGGNSGGPLLDTRGRVVGINTAYATDGQNIGFALEIDSVMPLVGRIRSGDSPVTAETPYIGVRTRAVAELPGEVRDNFEVDLTRGAFVSSVVPNSGAARAGLLAGDVITAFGGRSVDDPTSLGESVAASDVGARVACRYVRSGESRTATVRVGRLGD